jgi:hypothetical protein
VRASAIGAAVSVVLFDEDLQDLKTFLLDDKYVFRGELGRVTVSKNAVKHITNEHPEVTIDTIADAQDCLKHVQTRRGEFELWRDKSPMQRLNSSHLMLFKSNNILFGFVIQSLAVPQPGNDGLYIKTAYGFNYPRKGIGAIPNLLSQWSDAATSVAKFLIKENPAKLWMFNNPNPQFPHYELGDILDDGLKTYKIRFDIGTAEARKDRIILNTRL